MKQARPARAISVDRERIRNIVVETLLQYDSPIPMSQLTRVTRLPHGQLTDAITVLEARHELLVHRDMGEHHRYEIVSSPPPVFDIVPLAEIMGTKAVPIHASVKPRFCTQLTAEDRFAA